MRTAFSIPALLLATACGHSSSNMTADANGADGSAATGCADTCYQHRWWIDVASSNCNVLCMGTPGYPECAQSDCVQVSAERFDAGTLRTLAPMLSSAQHRGFYLLGLAMTDSYTVSAGCSMQVDTRPPQTFSCSQDTLSFSVGQFTAATAQENTALDAAATANAMGDYTY